MPRILLAVFVSAWLAGPALAQEPPPAVAETITSAPEAAPAPLILPAGSEIVLELVSEVSSASVQRGDPFALRLALPVTINGVTVLPAGLEGVGEVVEAARHGVGGKPGKLILSARSLQMEGRTLPLRGWKVLSAGDPRIGASVAATILIGFPGFFIKGKDAIAPAGARATAKTLEDFAAPETTGAQSARTGYSGEENQ